MPRKYLDSLVIRVGAFDLAHGQLRFLLTAAFVQLIRRFGQVKRQAQVQERPYHAHADQLGVPEDGAERVRVEHAKIHERKMENVRSTCCTNDVNISVRKIKKKKKKLNRHLSGQR